MALAEASRRAELGRPTPFTSAGRHAIGGRALSHPVLTLLVVYAVSRVVSLLALWVAATWFQNPAGVGHTEPGLQGDRSSAGTKAATVETGYEIQVPLFVEQGTKVKVDTRTGDYLGRVN